MVDDSYLLCLAGFCQKVIENNDCILCMNSIVNNTDCDVNDICNIVVLNHSILGREKEVRTFGGYMNIFIRKVGLFYASFYT